MRWYTRLIVAGFLMTASMPVVVWGYDLTGYPGDRGYLPYPSLAAAERYRGGIRIHTGMTEDGYYARAYLDGLNPEDIEVFIRRNRLVLQTARNDRYEYHDAGNRSVKRWAMRFRKQLRLPYDADPTRMTRSVENGILEIYLPRRSQYMPAEPSLELQQ